MSGQTVPAWAALHLTPYGWLEDDYRLLLTRLLTLPSGSRKMAIIACKIRDTFRGWVAALATNAHCHKPATPIRYLHSAKYLSV